VSLPAVRLRLPAGNLECVARWTYPHRLRAGQDGALDGLSKGSYDSPSASCPCDNKNETGHKHPSATFVVNERLRAEVGSARFVAAWPPAIVSRSSGRSFLKEPVCTKPDGLPRQVGETSIHQTAMLSDELGVSGWHLTVCVVLIAEVIVRSLAYR
jgi:hypothetical protein